MDYSIAITNNCLIKTDNILTFHVARFLRKKANLFINHWYISFSVNCFAGESNIAYKDTVTQKEQSRYV